MRKPVPVRGEIIFGDLGCVYTFGHKSFPDKDVVLYLFKGHKPRIDVYRSKSARKTLDFRTRKGSIDTYKTMTGFDISDLPKIDIKKTCSCKRSRRKRLFVVDRTGDSVTTCYSICSKCGRRFYKELRGD